MYNCTFNNFMMKINILVAIFICFFSSNLFSQEKTLPNSFEITGNYDKTKLDFYKSSILAASMEGYRLKEKDITIKFKEDFEVVIYSAKTLFLRGVNVDINNYKDEFPSEYTLPLFSVDVNGHILAEAAPYGKFRYK